MPDRFVVLAESFLQEALGCSARESGAGIFRLVVRSSGLCIASLVILVPWIRGKDWYHSTDQHSINTRILKMPRVAAPAATTARLVCTWVWDRDSIFGGGRASKGAQVVHGANSAWIVAPLGRRIAAEKREGAYDPRYEPESVAEAVRYLNGNFRRVSKDVTDCIDDQTPVRTFAKKRKKKKKHAYFKTTRDSVGTTPEVKKALIFQDELGSTIQERLETLVSSFLTCEGYSIVYVKLMKNFKTLQIFVERLDERAPAEEEIDEIARKISCVLDAESQRPFPYSLEVSPPGPNRPLLKTRDFQRFCGRKIKLTLKEELQKGSKSYLSFVADLRLADEENITVSMDVAARNVLDVPYHQIKTANLYTEDLAQRKTSGKRQKRAAAKPHKKR